MSKNGWEFLGPAWRRGSRFVRACVRVNDVFREIPIAELQGWLERMTFFDEPDSEWAETPGPTPPGCHFDFQVWAEDGRIWIVGDYDGLARLEWVSATPEAWLRHQEEAADD